MAETQPKPGNLYSPGTSGKKSVHERDKMKKAKIKNTPPPQKKTKLEKNQDSEVSWKPEGEPRWQMWASQAYRLHFL